jgi:transposase
MYFLSADTAVYIAREPVDMRKQIDGLALLVQEVLLLNPFEKQLFVFRNRGSNKLKVLVWHDNGFCLLYKRLERGFFPWPRAQDSVFCCSLRELQWLLEGLNIEQLPTRTAWPIKHV